MLKQHQEKCRECRYGPMTDTQYPRRLWQKAEHSGLCVLSRIHLVKLRLVKTIS